MLAEINNEAVGYLIGAFGATFIIPLILGKIFTKKWSYGLMFGIIGIVWQVVRLSTPKPEPRPDSALTDSPFFKQNYNNPLTAPLYTPTPDSK
jgi:hypothetical protein